jgi:hypothetical protein
MPARAARSTLAAVTAVLALFLLLLLMAVRVPANAAAGGNGTGAKADAAADNGKSADDHGKSGDSNGKAADKHSDSTDANGAQPTAASTTSPQPLSNADQNPGGANNGGDCGAYCSTRDGSPSGNGNGGGVASGKPCAGCVGKADNKNPPGQAPDGSDHNNGYECDGNSGIAKTNPAHTGCQTPTQSPSQSPSPTPSECVPSEANDHCGTPSPECTPTVENDNCGTPSVAPSSATQSPTITPAVKGVKIVKPPVQVRPGRLPRTGTAVPIGLLLALGFGAIALGVGVTVATPSHRH